MNVVPELFFITCKTSIFLVNMDFLEKKRPFLQSCNRRGTANLNKYLKLEHKMKIGPLFQFTTTLSPIRHISALTVFTATPVTMDALNPSNTQRQFQNVQSGSRSPATSQAGQESGMGQSAQTRILSQGDVFKRPPQTTLIDNKPNID